MNTPDEPLTTAHAESLTMATQPWLSCDDCFDHIDGYVDDLLRGGRGLGEPLRVHLCGCPACRAEAESLITLAAAEYGQSSGQALGQFRADLGLPGDTAPEQPTGITRLFRRRRSTDRDT